jgi:gamma-glutamylputrescine oxidase
MQSNPLWPVESRFPVLDKDARVDVAIVGAGIAGIACAFHLQNVGYSVAVLEAEEVGSFATGASSGILYYGSGGNFVEATQRYGHDNAAMLWKETARTIEDIVALIEKHRIKCGFRHTGAIMVAKDEPEEIRIEQEYAALARIGIRSKRLSGEDVEKSFKGTRFRAGLSFDMCSVIHPAQFTAELVKKFNVPVYEKSPMATFTEEADRVVLRTSKATVTCDRLILATNLQPIQGLEKHFAEESTVVLASREMADIRSIWPEDKVIWTMEEKYDILYPLGNRLALELYQARQVKQKIAQYYTGVPFEIRYRWGESWAKAADLLPIAGPLTDRVYAAVAMGDEGIVMGYAIGNRINVAIEGGSDPLLSMTSPSRFGNRRSSP